MSIFLLREILFGPELRRSTKGLPGGWLRVEYKFPFTRIHFITARRNMAVHDQLN